MAHKYKLVGNLVFNQEDGEVLHAKTAETLAKFPVMLELPLHMLAKSVEVAIDSTGEKEVCGHFRVTLPLLKHLTEAYLTAYAEDPSATDAVVDVELMDTATGTAIATISYSGEGGSKASSNIASTLKDYVDKLVHVRIKVSTASATSGATQVFRSIVLRLVYDFT